MRRTCGNIRFITLSSLPDFQIVAGQGVKNAFPTHFHDKFCVGMIAKGGAVLQDPRRVYRLGQGHMYFLNPGHAHQIQPDSARGFDHMVFCFGYEFLKLHRGENGFPQSRFNIIATEDPAFCRPFFDFYNQTFYSLKGEQLKQSLLALFDIIPPLGTFWEYENRQHESHNNSLVDACHLIKENCHKNLSLDELASSAHLSKYHFCRIFKGATGLSPYEYQLQARIKAAKTRLLNKEPIADVAAGLRFADQSHFYRYFKRNTGVTPGEFVKMNINL